MSTRTIPISERFWDKVDIRSLAECWLWVGSRRHRYGEIWRNNKREYAHRMSYELVFGSIPQGMSICHSCDTPLCVNPVHLFAGSQSDNAQDALAKGRLRGFFGSPENPRQPPASHCRNGHEYTAENTYHHPAGTRKCRTCTRAGQARYLERRRAA